jgi:hypothetical protein
MGKSNTAGITGKVILMVIVVRIIQKLYNSCGNTTFNRE